MHLYIHTPAKWVSVVCTFCLHVVLNSDSVCLSQSSGKNDLKRFGSCSCEAKRDE